MKKIIPVTLFIIITVIAFLLNHQPASGKERDRVYNRRHNHSLFNRYYEGYGGNGYYRGYYNNRRYRVYPRRYCYPVTQWLLDQDPGYHPRAYSDGYRQGSESAKKGNAYKPRTAGGEFGRGFDDGYYGREFSGQKHIVANAYLPFTTSECNYF
ncbi:hypothetical protein [Calothrix sp. UHCC 0171]|uniref:hypothetical protein n=1 Tax=Calothrix sp. UHCC 0171 TaxID=3110245 RepID=UPI002B1ECCBE|nr:hypothetical protein [Calothrix sp. UHCC 0171]MEA5571533.1 hypothetical protein [Calothrix sp. UHCC 0171]